MLGDALEVAREPVGVAGVAEHPRLLQPVRGEQPPLVELVQVGRALGVRRRRGAHQPGEQRTRDLGVGMDLGDRRLEVGPVAVQPQREGLPPVGAQPARAHQSVQAERAFELPGRRGVDLARCAHPSHPRIAGPALRSSACAAPVPFLLVAGVVTAVVVGGGVVALGRDDDERRRRRRSRSRRRRCRSSTPPDSSSPVGRSATRSTTARSTRRSAAIPRTPRPGRTATPSTSATAWRTSPTSSAAATPPRTATMAQAWVFAPPVDAAGAQRLVKAAGKATGCEAGTGPAFGAPTLALTCTKDGVVRASYRGLFGDAWLVCEVARPAGADWDVVDRAGRWCVGVRAGRRWLIAGPATIRRAMALALRRLFCVSGGIVRTRVVALTAACLALGALSFGAGAAPATSQGSDRSTEPSLPHSAHGQEAIRLLGDQLDEAAASTAGRRRSCAACWPPTPPRGSTATAGSSTWTRLRRRRRRRDRRPQDVAPFPLAQTPSRCTATRLDAELFIDFDGTTVSRHRSGTRRRACPTASTRRGTRTPTGHVQRPRAGARSRPSGSGWPRTTPPSTST